MTENVDIAVIGPELEEHVFRAVPLIDYFFCKIFVRVQLEAMRCLVGLATGVTLNVKPRRHIVAQNQHRAIVRCEYRPRIRAFVRVLRPI